MNETDTRVSGRAAVVESGGKPWSIWTERIAVGNGSVFQQSNDVLDLTLDPGSGQAPWARGQVEVIADVSGLTQTSGVPEFFYLEVNVIGYLGSGRLVLARLALGNGRLVATVPLDEPWEQIGFEARLSTTPVEGGVGLNSLGYSAIARVYR